MDSKKKLKTYKFIFFIQLLLLLVLTPRSAAQDKLYFQSVSKDQGLSHATILTIIQDRKGFLWFGTPNGLNRYDGYSFKVFRHYVSDSNSLPDNIVLSLKQDSKGLLWIGTRSGLCSMDPATGKISRIHPPDQNHLFNARDIVQYKKRNVWIGTEYGLYYVDPDMKMKKYPDKQLETSISSIQYDSDGNLWVAIKDQLFKITQSQGTVNPTAEKITLSSIGSHISKLYLDPYGILWIASQNEGLGILDTKREVIIPVVNLHAQKTISAILRTSATSVLTGSEEGGFYQVTFGIEQNAANEKSVSVRSVVGYTADVSNPQAVCSENVKVLYRDRTNNVWIGSIYSGLSKASLTQKKFKHIINLFKDKSGKTDNYVWGINQLTLNSKKYLLAGTSYNGLYFLSPGYETIYKHFYKDNDAGPSLRENFTGPIYIDSKKNVWIGSFRGGLQHYNPFTDRMTHYVPDNTGYENSLADWSIRDIIETRAGELWVGTANGASKARLDKNDKIISFKSYRNEKHNPNSIANNTVWCVFQDAKGSIWLGTEAGLSIYNEKEDHFDNIAPGPGGVLSNTIKVIHERLTKEGQELWIGGNKGLCRLRVREGDFYFKNYTEEDGLCNMAVYGILEDKNNNLWISTDNGLSKFNPADESFQNYYKIDGITDNQFFPRSFYKDKESGEFFFGGINGITYFDPAKIEKSGVLADVALTDFKLFNQSVQANKTYDENVILTKLITHTDSIALKHNQADFSIEFAALHFQAPMKNGYQYMLEGYDTFWKSAKADKREASYTNLPPGSYVFMVKVSNNDGVWSDKTRKLYIIIAPPVWKTWWAYSIYALLLTISALSIRNFLTYKSNLRNQLIIERLQFEQKQELMLKEAEVNQFKLKFFMNVSHEFRTPLTLIIGPVENLLNSFRESPPIYRQLELMSRNAHRLMNLINQLLTMRQVETGNLELKMVKADLFRFLESIFQSFNPLAEQQNVRYTLESNFREAVVPFDRDVIEKIVNNLLSNAFKFTPPDGSISLYLRYFVETGLLTVSVEDSGAGIEEEAIPLIFERFYSSDKKNISMTPGSGIGLALTKELVELYEGEITVKSTPGKGSLFTVVLPLRKAQGVKDSGNCYKEENLMLSPPVPKDEEEEQPGNLDAPIVLIIDDNDEIRSFLRLLLQNEYQIFEAENGEEGLNIARQEIPDIILCDVMMPDLEGFEVTQRLKNEELTSHIPILMLTARTANEQQIMGLESGADDYITKPFNASVLTLKIRNALTRKRVLKAYLQNNFSNEIDQKFIARLNEIIDDNLEKPDFGHEELSRLIYMSKSQIYRKVHAVTNQTVHEYIRNRRLIKAKELLKKGTHKISEVAYLTGFYDHAQFTRSFKKTYSISPSEFIKSK